jgi:hypothetical protein
MAMESDDSLELLRKLQSLVEVGRDLTTAMEKAEPYLSHPPPTATASRMWVRPLPTSMDQVNQVLAVARHLAPRTSAPAGWNPNAPVIGFTTPNPLPHQLRGGALGALQLERARQLERDRKRQRQLKAAREADKAKGGVDHQEKNEAQDHDENGDETMTEAMIDPKRRELAERQQERLRQQTPAAASQRAADQQPQQQRQQQQPMVATTMNLSDSSSSDDEDEDD